MASKRKDAGAGDAPTRKKARKDTIRALDNFVPDEEFVSDHSEDRIINFTDTGARRAESEARRAWNYVCGFAGCGQRFNRPCRLEAHLRSHNKERPFACTHDGCDKTFPRKDHLQRHLRSSHAEQERNFVCDWVGCGKSFTSNGRLKRHRDVHETKLYCTAYPPCNEAFRKQKTLEAHVRTQHLEAKPYPCTYVDPTTNERCTNGYQTEGKLRKHLANAHVEPEEEEHFCMICIPPGTEFEITQNEAGEITRIPKVPLSFPSREELQAHAKEAHPPTCPICEVKFRDHYSLKKHYQTVHGDPANQPQFPCPREGCYSVFNKRTNLNVHIQAVHDKVPKFFCTADAVSSSKHADLHGWNGDNACGAPFKAKSSLEQHIRTHHLDLPNRKDIRKRAKPRKKQPEPSALDLLTGVGYEQREVSCMIQNCEYRFFRDQDLRRHLLAEHDIPEAEGQEMILERDAMTGGQFWIGGLDEQMFESTEPSMPQTPMPYFENQDPFSGVFDSNLNEFEMMDVEGAELDAAMGLGDLPPATDVHEGLHMDKLLNPVQQFNLQHI
ncbi:zinc finger protein 585A [Lentithecium fluviatile CBS 122367]|uniref:Zinc finger protein 585A n=1 Tax=Lentithecium fluviatile CBS 122367 TaxID=1168545 RepID=A0A6G1JM42_9PLEO|nr:zinc finger protein 585A [Lentithecium fluviatile CBS 122367]